MPSRSSVLLPSLTKLAEARVRAHNLECASTGQRSYASAVGRSARTITISRLPQSGGRASFNGNPRMAAQ